MKTVRALAILASAVILAAMAPTAACAATPPPSSMASLGDSITRAFNACGWYSDCPTRSWSTGDESLTNSHYLRIKEINPAITGRNHNDSRSGATSADMVTQADVAVTQNVQYITMLIGANDACAATEDAMTPVDTYRARIDAALAKIKTGLPNANVLLLSIPDIKRLWFVGKDNPNARFFWSMGHICQSMLANPTSTSTVDAARRDRVRQRVIDFNTQLAQACAAYGPNCAYDNFAVFNYQFQVTETSTWDYFHPNADGQRALAKISYEAGFGW